MLSRESITAAAAAVLLSFGTFNQARAQFQPGDFITYAQEGWGDPLHQGGMTLTAHYDVVYVSAFGLVEVGIPGPAGFSIIFTGTGPVLNYLPSSGPPAPLNADLIDPTSSASGIFGGEVLGLRFNVDFSDAGYTLGEPGISFGDLVIHDLSELPQWNGLTVRQALAQLNTLLGGGAVGYSAAVANEPTFNLNRSFFSEDPLALQWAQDHLRIAIPGDYNFDGSADAADYTVWRDTVGSTTDLAADGNASGEIDDGDYDVWRAHFGQGGSGASAAAGSSSAPEPSTLAMLLAGMMAMFACRPANASHL